ncbi:DUF4184 family protein [Chloroflexota bacterium]|nr:DUF4184 family protein [Chloroflexota bacterium]
MPFTPIHLGIAAPVKAVSNKKFHLMIFAWAQVVMDIQPLIVILTHHGRTHGITHTFIGAIVLGLVAAVSGRYLLELAGKIVNWKYLKSGVLSWKVVFISAYFGTPSHVLLDALIYPDMDFFWPFMAGNPLRIGVSSLEMYGFCLLSGLIGSVLWVILFIIRKRKMRQGKTPDAS